MMFNKTKIQLAGLFAAFLTTVIFCLVTGCKTTIEEKNLKRFEFGAPKMGTWWRIVLYATDKELAEKAANEAFKKIAELDDKFTDYYAESQLMQLCYKSGNGEVKVDDELYDIISKAIQISEKTDGAFDITAGPSIQLWRWSGRHNQLASKEKMDAALKLVGYKKIKLNPKNRSITLTDAGMRLDLGGIAKGYGADTALKILKKYGISRALVAASGDIAVGEPPPGKKGWKIEIGSGENKTNTLGITLVLKNKGVSTSGDVEQFIEINGIKYSHILNPKTGLGLTNRIQVTVIAECATKSDPLATACCVLGLEKGIQLIESDKNTAALFIAGDGTNKVIKPSTRFKQFIDSSLR
ncbi:MAG: FAD:protein FMN transferase [Verrucomicrobiia bacterium]